MDFVAWCDHVLTTLVRMEKDSLVTRHMGVVFAELLQKLTDGMVDQELTDAKDAVVQAVDELRRLGLIEPGGTVQWIRPSRQGKLHVQDPTQLWDEICAIRVDDEERQLIRAVNARSPRNTVIWAMVEYVAYDELGMLDSEMLSIIGRRLERDFSLVAAAPHIDAKTIRSTYRGLVWETRRGMLGVSRWLDHLVAEWETTSVDFKRALETGTADQQAEFVTDVLGLANTQASGRRWMIIGFDDKTRTYWGAPNPTLNPAHLAQILSQYTTPMVQVRYDVVDFCDGPVGVIEVLRDPAKIPYRVATALGEQKRIEPGQVFVRHGSQSEEPTPGERTAIEEETGYV